MVIKKVNALESSSSPVICLFLLSSAKHKVGNCKKPGDGEDALESGCSLFGGSSGLVDSFSGSASVGRRTWLFLGLLLALLIIGTLQVGLFTNSYVQFTLPVSGMDTFQDALYRLALRVRRDEHHILFAFRDGLFPPDWRQLDARAADLRRRLGLDFPAFLQKLEQAAHTQQAWALCAPETLPGFDAEADWMHAGRALAGAGKRRARRHEKPDQER